MLMFKPVAGSLLPTRLNMVSWTLYFNLIIQVFISSIIVVNGWEQHYRISNQLTNDDSRFYGWLAIQWVMLSIPIGMYLSTILFGYKSNNKLFRTYVSKQIETFDFRREFTIKLCLSVLSLVSFIAVAYTFVEIGGFPQIDLFSISGIVASELREDVGRNFEGSSIIRNIFGLTLTPILSYVWFAYYCRHRTLFYFSLFLIFFVMSALIVTYNLAKSPLIFYLLGFVFLTVYIRGFIKFRTLVIVAIAAILLLTVFYFLIFNQIDPAHLFSLNSGIGGRIILGQSMGTYFSFDIFPSQHPFLGFGSFSDWVRNVFMHSETERSSRILMQILDPSGVQAGTSGVMNTLFIGEAWANFGLYGVLISPLIVGFYIQSLFMFFLTSKKTPIYLGVFAYLSYRLPVVGSFNEFVYNPIHIVIFTILLLTNLLASKNEKS